MNTAGEDNVQGQKSLARALGGGSAQLLRRESSAVDAPDGVTGESSKSKKNRPILQRMRQKIVQKLRTPINLDQELIQDQLEQDLQRTRTRTGTGKQLRRRFTDWF